MNNGALCCSIFCAIQIPDILIYLSSYLLKWFKVTKYILHHKIQGCFYTVSGKKWTPK